MSRVTGYLIYFNANEKIRDRTHRKGPEVRYAELRLLRVNSEIENIKKYILLS